MPECHFDRIVKMLGFRSGAELARHVERSRKAASRWRKEGFPPAIQLQLLDLAETKKVALSPQDLRRE